VYFSPVYAYVRLADKRFDAGLSRANDPSVKIATIDGELSSIIAVNDFPNAPTTSLPQQTDVSQLLLQLTASKADITFVEPAIAEAFLKKNPNSIRRVASSDAVRLFPNAYLFKKGDAGLRDAINVAIMELQNDGEVSRILEKYDPEGNLFIPVTRPVSP
jgi:ABC-type amino acid transport substrate-binding protein